MKLATLKRLCDPSHPQVIRHAAFVRDGYMVATDGRSLFAVKSSATKPPPKDTHKAFGYVSDMLKHEPGSLVVATDKLRTWAGTPEWSRMRGRGKVACPEFDCWGVGRHQCEPGPRKGTMSIGNDRIYIDRNRVAQALDGATDATVRIDYGKGDDPVYFDGDGWRAIVMPMLLAYPPDGEAIVLP